MLSSSLCFEDHFSIVDDPRLDRKKRHELLDILFVCVAGTIAGCDGPSDISEFATTQLELDVPPTIVAYATQAMLLLSFGGITYGVMSTQLDEEAEQALLSGPSSSSAVEA